MLLRYGGAWIERIMPVKIRVALAARKNAAFAQRIRP